MAWSMPELYGSAGQAPAPATAPAPQRFAPLSVQAQASAGSAPAEEETDAAARLLLPAGFSTESPMQALAVDGT